MNIGHPFVADCANEQAPARTVAGALAHASDRENRRPIFGIRVA